MNIPGDRGYGRSYSKSGKKMGTKSVNMKVGKLTDNSQKSTKVHRNGYKSVREKKWKNINISDDRVDSNNYWCLAEIQMEEKAWFVRNSPQFLL